MNGTFEVVVTEGCLRLLQRSINGVKDFSWVWNTYECIGNTIDYSEYLKVVLESFEYRRARLGSSVEQLYRINSQIGLIGMGLVHP